MSFNYNGPTICDVMVNSVSGRPGIGVSELCFSLGFQVSAFAKQDVMVRDFHVRVAERVRARRRPTEVSGHPELDSSKYSLLKRAFIPFYSERLISRID